MEKDNSLHSIIAVAEQKLILPSTFDEVSLNPHSFFAAERTAHGDFAAMGKLPVGSLYYMDSPDQCRDPLFLAELIRQGIEVISRVLLGSGLID